jgi:hypothetical protein
MYLKIFIFTIIFIIVRETIIHLLSKKFKKLYQISFIYDKFHH